MTDRYAIKVVGFRTSVSLYTKVIGTKENYEFLDPP